MRWWQIRKRDADLERELRADLELEEEEQREKGASPEEAHYAARRAFGNATLIRERTHEVWSWNAFESCAREAGYCLRSLRRTPGFTIMAIIVMALGIGANVALFTVVRGVLLRPLPLPNADRLVSLYQSQKEFGQFVPIDGGSFALWREATRDSAEMAIVNSWQQYNVSSDGGQLPERVEAAWCSSNFFSMLGVTPALGRSFTAADDHPGAEATVILSNDFWKRRYSSDPQIVGSKIWLDAVPYTVVGVLPAWFKYEGAFVEGKTQLWTTVGHEAPPQLLRSFNEHAFVVVARLLRSATLESLLGQLNAVQRQITREHPGVVRDAVRGRSLLNDEVWTFKTPLYALLAATGCVLLIACVNVASLLVARAAARRKELAVRVALGGRRSHIVRERLIEGLLLSIGGGIVGAVLAWGALQWLIHVRQDMTRLDSIRIDGWVSGFTLGSITLCALVAGLTSSLSIDGKRLLSALHASSRGNSGHSRLGLRRALVALEVGLTVVLLIGAGLLMKSYQRMRTADLGIPTSNVLTMQFNLLGSRSPATTRPRFVGYLEEILERVRALPGVQSAGLINAAPGQGWGGDRVVAVPEHGPVLPGRGVDVLARGADPGYFSAVGIPLLRGRTFTSDERLDHAGTTVISADAAALLFPGEDAIGKQLRDSVSGETWQIVGIVGNTRFSVREPGRPTMYVPLFGNRYSSVTLVLRASHDVEALAMPVQRIIAGIKPDIPVFNVLTMDQTLGRSTVDESFDAILLVGFAALSLVLAAVGLFGVLSYMVAQRTSEIGIRIALGAQREHVLRKVLFDGIGPALVGLLAGLTASAALVHLIRSILYDTHPLDPAVFGSVAGLLLLVATMACLAPAWRASRLDPMQALRNE
jgi:predicted permease